MPKRNKTLLEIVAFRLSKWMGTPISLLVHTVFFTTFPLSGFIIGLEQMLLVFTLVLSLEAIYIGIMNQMSINYQTHITKDVHDTVDDMQDTIEEVHDEVKAE